MLSLPAPHHLNINPQTQKLTQHKRAQSQGPVFPRSLILQAVGNVSCFMFS